MADIVIRSGICGFSTRVHSEGTPNCTVALTIESDCAAVRRLAEALTAVDAMREFTYRGDGPLILAEARRLLTHPSCIVPQGMIKAVEVAAGLALPAHADIRFVGDAEGGS